MATLEKLLRDRFDADPRVRLGELDARKDQITIRFGAVGEHSSIVLGVTGDKVEVLHPAPAQADVFLSENKGERPKTDDANDPANPPEGSGPALPGSPAADPFANSALVEDVEADAHTKDELLAIAADRGVEVKSGATKAEIAEAINAKV